MIRKLLTAFGIAAALALPGAAQTFTHTINGVPHTHDTTTYRTVGTCCAQTYGCSSTTSSVHAPRTTTRTYTSAPTTTRTYKRTYTQAPVTRTYSHAPVTRTYTSAPVVTRRVYVTPPRTAAVSYHPGYYRPRYHDDRAQPYAHYDRKWKSRTRGSSRGHHRH